MEVVIFVLLLLKDFANSEITASLALRNQKYGEQGLPINKLMPQKVYVAPKVVPKLNPLQIIVRPNNRVNGVPKVIIPVANQQKNMKPPTVSAVKEAKPITASNKEVAKELKKPVNQIYNKNEKPNKDIQQIQNSKPKEPEFFEEVDTDDVTILDIAKTILNNPPEEDKSQEKPNKQHIKTDSLPQTIINPKQNQKETVIGIPPKIIPIVNENHVKLIPINVNKNEEIPQNQTQVDINTAYNKEQGSRSNNPDKVTTAPDDNTKFAIPITIYNFDEITDSYSKAGDNKLKGYPIGRDYLNQQTSNVVFKYQDVEELCETIPNINSYETYQTVYDYQPLTNYYHNISPKYQTTFSPYNPTDRIWRNWKTTELYMTNVPEFQNNEYDRINGFSTPIMNGDMRYDAYNNMPPYRCYAYSIYKYM